MSDAQRAPVRSTPWLGALRARYLEWANGFDAEWARSVRWPAGWVVSGAVLALFFVVAAEVPSARAFFGLRLAPALLFEAVALSVLLVADQLEVRGYFDPAVRGAVTLAVGALLQAFSSGVVALSSPPGAFALAALPIATAWYHLGLLRSGPRHPFGTLAHAMGMVAGCALAPHPAHLALFAAIALFGLGGGTIFGLLSTWAVGADASLDAHRAALRAQSLAAFASELEEVEAALTDAVANADDTTHALEAALVACDEIASASAARGASGPVGEVTGRIRSALERFGRLVAPGTAGALPADGEPLSAPVLVLPVVRAALADAARRWPDLSFDVAPGGTALQGAVASVRGGSGELRRMLDPLLANACEGDGAFGASRVEVGIVRDPSSKTISIDVCDDGPGFPAELIARPISLLGTSKSRGTGLGLYTAERLARGSRGALARENRPEGGARVRLKLPDGTPPLRRVEREVQGPLP